MKKGVFLILLLFIIDLSLFCQKISLKLSGNENSGYDIQILFGNKIVATNEENGEFTLILENVDRSIIDTIHNFKALYAEENLEDIVLYGKYYAEELMTDIVIEVCYSVVNDHVVKKEISIEQNNIPMLFYQLENKLSPPDTNVSFWSFEHMEHKGGSIREIYPAAGFIFKDFVALGLLTDGGYWNQWTRNIRKRPTDQRQNNQGFKAVQTIADVNLYRIANGAERSAQDYYVGLTFGELSDYNIGGRLNVLNKDDFVVKSVEKQSGITSGIKIPFTSSNGFYTINFMYRSASPVNFRLLKTRNRLEETIGFHYKTGFPATSGEWFEIKESALLQGLENTNAQLLIESQTDIEIKDFQIQKITPKKYPYHRMSLGEKQTKTIFIFAQEAKDLRALRLASQTRLAEGAGFEGSDVEKVVYADFLMLTWITSWQDFSPHNVPSINYAPDMYNRDSFWSIVAVYDRDLNESVWKKWGGTQAFNGAIGTIITPYMGSIEKKGNEATCQWIWWALINKRRYGSTLDTLRLKKALEFCLMEFDSDGDGIVSSHFSLSQNDVVYYEQKTSNLAVNQGVYAITLMAAKELGFNIDQQYIDKAIKEYRNFYDQEKGYLISDKDYPYVISLTDLMPEFMSWWLWDSPMLTDEMVINTLNKVPVINDCSPIIFHLNDTFFTNKNKPFLSNMYWPNGQYYNGGSWMRNEICAYVVGKKHGWEPAKDRIENRMLAEINLNYDEPFSHEIIPTDLYHNQTVGGPQQEFLAGIFLRLSPWRLQI